jgi:hypothetical protein
LRTKFDLQQPSARKSDQPQALLSSSVQSETLNPTLINEYVMTDQTSDLLEAVPIFRLVCPNSDELVGIEYHWNNGEAGILWRVDPIENFVRRPINGEEGQER